MDISADLTEMSQKNVAVVSAGVDGLAGLFLVARDHVVESVLHAGGGEDDDIVGEGRRAGEKTRARQASGQGQTGRSGG